MTMNSQKFKNGPREKKKRNIFQVVRKCIDN